MEEGSGRWLKAALGKVGQSVGCGTGGNRKNDNSASTGQIGTTQGTKMKFESRQLQ